MQWKIGRNKNVFKRIIKKERKLIKVRKEIYILSELRYPLYVKIY